MLFGRFSIGCPVVSGTFPLDNIFSSQSDKEALKFPPFQWILCWYKSPCTSDVPIESDELYFVANTSFRSLDTDKKMF